MESNYEKRGYLKEDYHYFRLKSAGAPSVDYHYHEFGKLMFLWEGAGYYVIEGCRYSLQPGDMVLVPRGSVHRPELSAAESYYRTILYLSGDFIKRNTENGTCGEELFSSPGGHVLRPSPAEKMEWQGLLEKMEGELNGEQPGSAAMARCLLTELLILLGRKQQKGRAEPLSAPGGDEKMREILLYINAHLAEEIPVEALSERFYISKYHMMRRFKQETGMPVHSYITEKRLLLARDCMDAGESATAACYRSGFQSYSSFSRAYQKRFGVSPTGKVRREADRLEGTE